MTTYTDPAQVERLLKSAIGFPSKPELSTDQITDMVTLAGSDGTYTSEGMQRAAAQAWRWKAALTAAQYDIGGQGGAKLTRSQWFDHCTTMASLYGSGAWSVDGEADTAQYGGITIEEMPFLTGPAYGATVGGEW